MLRQMFAPNFIASFWVFQELNFSNFFFKNLKLRQQLVHLYRDSTGNIFHFDLYSQIASPKTCQKKEKIRVSLPLFAYFK